jgi:hypothetical protein
MARKRKAYAPFSLTSEAGVAQTPLEGYIDVDQTIYATVNTGTINENGKWSGVKASDDEFVIAGTEVAVPNGQEILTPGGNTPFIDMTGFASLFIAIKPSRGGNCAITAVMGTDTEPFANLSPVAAANTLRGNVYTDNTTTTENLFNDAAESMTADVWNIFYIQGRLANQKNMQFKITNNSGGNSDIQFAYMRTV